VSAVAEVDPALPTSSYRDMKGTLLAAAAVTLLFAAVAPKDARAALSLGAEAGPILLLDPPPDTSLGFGFAGRVGYKLGLPLLALTPEVKVAVDKLPGGNSGLRGMAGARVEIGALLSPFAFAHIGYGKISGDSADLKGVAIDVGAGLDFTPLPIIDVGVLLSYNRVLDDPVKAHWIFIGATATLAF
jgi:hypothetical protein